VDFCISLVRAILSIYTIKEKRRYIDSLLPIGQKALFKNRKTKKVATGELVDVLNESEQWYYIFQLENKDRVKISEQEIQLHLGALRSNNPVPLKRSLRAQTATTQ
jgi:hypothetical protein